MNGIFIAISIVIKFLEGFFFFPTADESGEGLSGVMEKHRQVRSRRHFSLHVARKETCLTFNSISLSMLLGAPASHQLKGIL